MSTGSILVCSTMSSSLYSSICSILEYHDSLVKMWICSRPLNTLDPTMFSLPSMPGGVFDPSM